MKHLNYAISFTMKFNLIMCDISCKFISNFLILLIKICEEFTKCLHENISFLQIKLMIENMILRRFIGRYIENRVRNAVEVFEWAKGHKLYSKTEHTLYLQYANFEECISPAAFLSIKWEKLLLSMHIPCTYIIKFEH